MCGGIERRLGAHRYGLVLALTVAIVLWGVAAPSDTAARSVALVLQGVTLAAVVITSGARVDERRWIALSVLIVVAGLGFVVTLGGVREGIALGVAGGLVLATLPMLALGVLRLLRTEGVTERAVFGGLAIYLMIGLLFAWVIGVAADVTSGPYFTGRVAEGSVSDHVYFSFTTLTTTGFGDIAAATRFGRAVAVLESLTGQIYLVTVVALLISNLGRTRRQ